MCCDHLGHCKCVNLYEMYEFMKDMMQNENWAKQKENRVKVELLHEQGKIEYCNEIRGGKRGSQNSFLGQNHGKWKHKECILLKCSL